MDIADGIKTIDDEGVVVPGPRADRAVPSNSTEVAPRAASPCPRGSSRSKASATITSGALEREEGEVEVRTRRSPEETDEVVVTSEVTAADKRRALLWSKSHLSLDEDIELQQLLISYRRKIEQMAKPNQDAKADLAYILSNPPEERLRSLRVRKNWERFLTLAGALRFSANGTIGPGPRYYKLEEYEANKPDILAGRLRISSSTGKVIPVESRQAPPPPRRTLLTRKEVEERKRWLFELPLMAQRARFDAVKKLDDLRYQLTEEQKVDLEYLKDILRM